MTKPTREEVEEMLTDFEAHELIGSRRDVYELVVGVFKGWLAQGEELKRLWKLVKYQDEFIMEKSKVSADRSTLISQLEVELDQLKAESQALKASMEAEYIERQAKHIQVLVKENEAFKEEILRLEA